MAQITALGSSDDGKFGIYNQGLIIDFCKKHSDKRLIITVQVEEKESIAAMLAYFYAAVLPGWKERLFILGIVTSEADIEKSLRSLSPITENKRLSELNRDELIRFLDHVNMVSLRDLQLFMDDPRTI